MNLKFIIKQSYKEFSNKKSLYAVFTVFLALSLGMMVGLLSFLTTYNLKVDAAFNGRTVNAFSNAIKFNNNVDDQELEKEFDWNVSDEFLNKIKTLSNKEYSDEVWNEFITITGQNYGNVYSESFADSSKELQELAKEANEKMYPYTKNYFSYFTLQDSIKEYKQENIFLITNVANFKFDEISVGSSLAFAEKFMYSNEEWDLLPEIFKANDLRKNVYVELMDFKWLEQNHKEDFDSQNYVFVSPTFAKENNYKVGSKYKFLINGKEEELYLGGTYYNRQTIYGKKTQPHISIGIKKILGISNFEELNSPNYDGEKALNDSFAIENFYIDTGYDSDIEKGQRSLNEKILSNYFVSKNDSGVKYLSLDNWSSNLLEVLHNRTASIITTVFIVISIGLLVLLLFVFYFMTAQFIKLQKNTLYFLKNIGQGNVVLSILTTCSLLIPMIVGMLVAIPISMYVSGIFFSVVKTDYSILFPQWFFDLKSAGIMILIVASLFIIFVIMNLIIIKGKSLTLSRIGASKAPAKFFQKIMLRISFLSVNTRLNISFTIDNIYKNITTFIVLLLAFSLTLFSLQFSSSLNYATRVFEQHNKPFESLKLETNLQIYSYDEDQQFDRFKNINSMDELTGIYDENDLIEKLKNPEIDIRDYYIDSSLTEIILNQNNLVMLETIKAIAEEVFEENEVELKEQFVEMLFGVFQNIKNSFSDIENITEEELKVNILFGSKLTTDNSFLGGWGKTIQNESLNFKAVSIKQSDDFYEKMVGEEKPKSIDEEFEMVRSFNKNKNEYEYVKAIKANASHKLMKDLGFKSGTLNWINLNGYKNDGEQMLIPFYINSIDQKNNFTKELSFAKEAFFKLLYENNETYLEAYTKLQSDESGKIYNNSNYSYTKIPDDLKNFTLPIVKNESNNKDQAGSQLLDYIDKNENEYLINNIANGVFIFSEITKGLVNGSEFYIVLMQRITVITCLITLSISLILIMLILLENKRNILLFKALGYSNNKVNKKLSTGYVLSAILAMAFAILISQLLIYKVASPMTSSIIGVSLTFSWSWSYLNMILITLGIFITAVLTSVRLYSKRQKPREAFSVL